MTDFERATAMRDLYSTGSTLQSIGTTYGLSRERVRQILNQHFGTTKHDGGQQTQLKAKRERKAVDRRSNPPQRGRRPTDKTLKVAAALREMSSLGFWKAKAARHLGLSEVRVGQISRQHSIDFPNSPQNKGGPQRLRQVRSPFRHFVRERYLAGIAPSVIAEETGRSAKHIMVAISQMGLSAGRNDPARYRRGFAIPDEKRSDFRLLRRKGFSAIECAKMLGLEAA